MGDKNVRHCVFDHIVRPEGEHRPGQFDKQGVMYLLGTQDGMREYANPHETKEVIAAMSSDCGRDQGSGSAKLVGHRHPGGGNFY